AQLPPVLPALGDGAGAGARAGVRQPRDGGDRARRGDQAAAAPRGGPDRRQEFVGRAAGVGGVAAAAGAEAHRAAAPGGDARLRLFADGPPRRPAQARKHGRRRALGAQGTGESVMSEPYVAIQVVMMPKDTSPNGTIFGGVILSYIDQAGAIGAIREIVRAGGERPRLVTVALNRVEFKEPVLVGDVVRFSTQL